MMGDDDLDIYYWPMDLAYTRSVTVNHNVEKSKITSIYPYNVGQILRKPNKLNESDFSSFFIENIRLLVIILIGFVLIVIAKFILLKLIKRRFSLYNLLNTNGTRLDSKSFKLGFLSLAFVFFLFFNLRILTNLIKTEKITVDTSEFIDSVSKLNRTTKILITWDKNTTNAFYRLFKKRKKNDDLVVFENGNMENYFSKISKLDLDSYYYFLHSFFLFNLMSDVPINRPVDYIVFYKPTIYFEPLRTIFYRKNLDPKMKQILNRRYCLHMFVHIFHLK